MWSAIASGLARAGAWAWAHKTEIGTAIQVWRRLRAKRKADQEPEETAKDYYVREGREYILERIALDMQDGIPVNPDEPL